MTLRSIDQKSLLEFGPLGVVFLQSNYQTPGYVVTVVGTLPDSRLHCNYGCNCGWYITCILVRWGYS